MIQQLGDQGKSYFVYVSGRNWNKWFEEMLEEAWRGSLIVNLLFSPIQQNNDAAQFGGVSQKRKTKHQRIEWKWWIAEPEAAKESFECERESEKLCYTWTNYEHNKPASNCCRFWPTIGYPPPIRTASKAELMNPEWSMCRPFSSLRFLPLARLSSHEQAKLEPKLRLKLELKFEAFLSKLAPQTFAPDQACERTFAGSGKVLLSPLGRSFSLYIESHAQLLLSTNKLRCKTVQINKPSCFRIQIDIQTNYSNDRSIVREKLALSNGQILGLTKLRPLILPPSMTIQGLRLCHVRRCN